MQIVILIPLGTRTGGPEALHQLSDSLLGQGYDARVWYTAPGDLEVLAELVARQGAGDIVLNVPSRINPIAEYAHYRTVPADMVHLGADTCFVLPEVNINWMRHLQRSRSVIWWLSVDNALEGLGTRHVNLNSLRSRRVLHAFQSTYAREFVQALGISHALPLSDYTPPSTVDDISSKTDIALNAGAKVIYDVAAIAARLERECNTRVHLIKGMDRDQVYDALGRSKLFIDFGNFPGKDRMAREALLRGCCVFALDVGAARDYSLPNEFYFKPDDVDQVFAAAQLVLADHAHAFGLQQAAVQAVTRERLVFERDVGQLARAVGCSKNPKSAIPALTPMEPVAAAASTREPVLA